jgi:hypothetical protein
MTIHCHCERGDAISFRRLFSRRDCGVALPLAPPRAILATDDRGKSHGEMAFRRPERQGARAQRAGAMSRLLAWALLLCLANSACAPVAPAIQTGGQMTTGHVDSGGAGGGGM